VIRTQRGQATVEFLAMIPILVLVLVGAFQLFLLGFTMNETSSAARAAARAGSLGEDYQGAGKDSLESWLKNYLASITKSGTRYTVTVNVPVIFPGIHGPAIGRSASIPSTK
jgi:Flp pilus assembly protein TadG